MVDCGCKKIQVKGEKQRSNGEKKYGRHTSSIFDSKGVGCAKYEGIHVQSVRSVGTSTPYTLHFYTLHPTLYTLHSPLRTY